MKNFKKVLALVLAVVMLLSFATVASAVTSDFYEDVDDINYTEAVDVLSYIGVLNGYPDDTFRPEYTITRAEAAKIIAMFDNGSTDISKLYAAANPFSDCANHWAESYIAYGVKTGIIAGIGGDKFAPEANVTGVQFLKMALVVLGYDAKAEGMEGKNWDVNTLALAKRVGLTKVLGNKFDYSADLTREQAAVIMLNALRAGTVEYGSKFVMGSLKYDAKKGFYYDVKGSQPYMTVAGAVLTGDKLMKTWNLEEGYTTDAFYRPYRVWKNTLTGKTIGTKYMFATEAEYTTKFSECELLVDLGVDKTDVDPLVYNLIVNGAFNDRYTTAHTTVNHAPTGDCAALNVTLGGQGTLTQVFDIDEEIAQKLYDDEFDDGGYYVIEIETWLGQVKTAQKTTVNSDGHLVQGTEATVKVFTGTDVHTPATCERFDAPTQDAAVLKTTAKGLAKDDYVLVTYSDRNDGGFKPGIVDIDVVAPTNGTLTGYKWNNYTSQTAVDGTYIPDSYHFHEDYTASKTSGNIGGTFGFIYDAYGNVIGMVEEVGTSTKYLVVDKMALTQENVYDAVVRANVVGLDAATTEKVSVASVKDRANVTWTPAGMYNDANPGNKYFFWAGLKDVFADDLGTWTLDAYGRYVIDLSVGERFLTGPYSITKGIPEVKNTTAAIRGTDASTKYLIHENDGTYTSVTGYKNIDTLKAENVEIVDVNGDGVAEIVYLWGSIARAGDSFVAYVTYNVDEWRELVGTTKFYKGTVYVNGVATDICLDADDYNTLVANGSGFYKFNYTKVNADSESYAKIVAQGADLTLNTYWYGHSIYDDMFTATKHGDLAASNLALADDVVVYRITTKATVVKAENAKDYLEIALTAHNYPDPYMHLGFNAAGQVNVIYVHEDPVS